MVGLIPSRLCSGVVTSGYKFSVVYSERFLVVVFEVFIRRFVGFLFFLGLIRWFYGFCGMSLLFLWGLFWGKNYS